MPVNLIDIQKKIKEYAARNGEHHRVVADRQTEASRLIAEYADRLDELKARFNRAAEVIPRLRCAVPVDEPLDSVIPMPAPPERCTLLSADGSQINPSRHTRVPFCVINVSVVKMVCGSGEAPQIATSSRLLDYKDLFPSAGGMASESDVAMMRDLEERQALIEEVIKTEPPAIAMIDGSLGLVPNLQDTSGFEAYLGRYINSLSQCADKTPGFLGYIDNPQSDLVCRLLELTALSDVEIARYHQTPRRFLGVKDISVFSDLLANPGERSAVFAIHSQTAQHFRGDLALHFFYLNVGLPGKPHLARVEIPAWVARDRALVGVLQAILTAQSSILGTRPYPYLLHRAHEEANIPISEHRYVEEMIVAELERRGIPIEEGSYKQELKDLSTKKTRYQG